MLTAGNKARTVDVKACPHCGRESSDHGCRPGRLPGSWFCVSAGLVGGAYLAPSVDPDPAVSDPAVKRARDAEEKAQHAFDGSNAKWIDAVAKQRAAELKIQTGPALYAGDMTPILPDRQPARQRELRDAEAEARADREAAASRLVNARQATRFAEAVARRGRT